MIFIQPIPIKLYHKILKEEHRLMKLGVRMFHNARELG
jgi:hypothetical protein